MNKIKNLCCLLILVVFIGCRHNKNIKQVRYAYLEKLNSDYKFNSEINYYFNQTKDVGMAATDFSFVSEHQNLINCLISSDSTKRISAKTLSEIENQYEEVNAKKYIIEKSKEHEFLLINEAHFIPQHRNFLSDLLPQLYEAGYRNHALEGLGNSTLIESAIAENGYPELYHGYYPKEPEFGNLIRKAHHLGFNIFGYDGGSGEDREITGAKNILEKVESFAKKGKTIVLCGWDHIKEGPTETYWEYALAGRLKELSGTDPLTINQTQYYERANRMFEDSLYQALHFTEPTVLINNLNESIDLESNKDWYDVFVFHPRTVFTEGVPNWILKEKILKEFEIPMVDITFPYKILVFEKEDNIEKAVPTYIIELSAAKKKINIPVYPNRDYKILLANKEIAFLIE